MQAANDADAASKGWTPAMGSFGINTYPNSGGGSTGGGGGGGAGAPAVGGDLGGQIDRLLAAIAGGNKQAFDETVREFNQTFGLDTRKFEDDVRRFNQNYVLAQADLTGQYQGGPTLAAQKQYAELYGGAGGVPTAGQTTLAAQDQQYAQQMGLIKQAADLQANPFRQQQAIGQMGSLLGGQGVAAFQAPTTVPGVGTAGGNARGGMGYLSQMIQDIRDPVPNQTSMNQVLNAIPTPNKLNSVEFMRAAPSTQSLVLQGMQEKYGISPDDAQKQIAATLPQFTAPTTTTTFGTVRR